jgi:hypothetical protein
MSWLEMGPSTETSALELLDRPCDVFEEASDDVGGEVDTTTSKRVLKDLALMDLYFSVALR